MVTRTYRHELTTLVLGLVVVFYSFGMIITEPRLALSVVEMDGWSISTAGLFFVFGRWVLGPIFRSLKEQVSFAALGAVLAFFAGADPTLGSLGPDFEVVGVVLSFSGWVGVPLLTYLYWHFSLKQ